MNGLTKELFRSDLAIDRLRTFDNTIELLVKINLTGEVHSIKSSSDEV